MLSRGARRLLAELAKTNNARSLSWTPNSEVKREIAQPTNSFFYDDLEIELQPQHLRKQKPEATNLLFGKNFADHMFESYWRGESGWSQPKICPVHPLQMHPAAKYTNVSKTPNNEVKRETAQLANSFTYDNLKVELQPENLRKKKPDTSNLVFGKSFADHMFEINWSSESGWGQPKICPVHSLELHPAAKVLHYAQELFEGLKAYRGKDGQIRLFRPELNMQRLLKSADRLNLPTFDAHDFLRCLVRLVDIDRDWVPSAPMSSLYIRPTFFGTEPTLGLGSSSEAFLYVITGPVGPYYGSEIKPVSLLADPQYVRAWPGGTGDKKLGCNYAPTLSIQREADSLGLNQVLWLFGPDQEITEVGAMNVFALLRSKDGQPELVTPPLSGIILPGITRRSVLDLTREWNEFKVSERKITMGELTEALGEGRLLEMFGTGTACIISPIDGILHRQDGQSNRLSIPTMKSKWQLHSRVMRALVDIQYGVVDHPWSLIVSKTR